MAAYLASLPLSYVSPDRGFLSPVSNLTAKLQGDTSLNIGSKKLAEPWARLSPDLTQGRVESVQRNETQVLSWTMMGRKVERRQCSSPDNPSAHLSPKERSE